MQFYCYVYYDENWQAYYVGKGQGYRSKVRHRREITVPSNDRIQVFHFDNEWQAFECEVELISFWGRSIDGGCLSNKTWGGFGLWGMTGEQCPHFGKKHTKEAKQNMSNAKKGNKNWIYGKTHSCETKEKLRTMATGVKDSPETKARKSLAAKKAWALRKQKQQEAN